MLEILRASVEKYSPSGEEREIAEFYFETLEQQGYLVETQEVEDSAGRNIYAQKNQRADAESILFLGHIDTVPVSDKNAWQTEPLVLTEDEGRLYGLGASDMKGGIAAFLEAAKNTNSYVKILLTVDEENISQGAWTAVTKKKDFFKDVALIISAEPSFGREGHEVANGRTGRCVFEVEFKGKPVHIANYKEGVDAIEEAAAFLSELYGKREKLFKDKETVLQARKIEAESVGMSVCGEAKLEIEVLLGPKDSVKSVGSTLEEIAGEKARVKSKDRRTPYLEGYLFKDFPQKKAVSAAIKKVTGKNASYYFRKSVADDNVLATLGIPVITLGPNGGNEHKANEYVEINRLKTTEKVYVEILKLV